MRILKTLSNAYLVVLVAMSLALAVTPAMAVVWKVFS